jgi:molybdate transport system permease protein
VAGIGLLAAFAGRIGLLSDILDPLQINVVFTTTAVVLAVCFVAAPFYVRLAIASFETLDKDILDAARVDGAGPLRLLLSISIPLVSTGLAAGAALAFARGIGEFGATIMFAGNLRGVTQTLPLLIYQDFELSFDAACFPACPAGHAARTARSSSAPSAGRADAIFALSRAATAFFAFLVSSRLFLCFS